MGFSTAITGLKASTTELNVTGNNIANASTVGFKSGRTEFADIFSTVVVGSGSANSAGSGVIVADIAQNFTSGTIQFTNNNLDLAIDGSGFFQLNDGQGGISYTRAGGFELDKDGNVVAKNGNKLQGFGIIDGVLQPIGNLSVTEKESKPSGTRNMGLSVNIDDRSDADQKLRPYDLLNSSSYAFSTTNRVFDSLGNENTIKFDFVEQPAVRERQVVDLSQVSVFSGVFKVAGATLDLTTAPVPANRTELAAAIAALESDIIKTDLRIQSVKAVNDNVQVTYKASAANVDNIVTDIAGASVTFGDLEATKGDFSASAVHQLVFDQSGPNAPGNGQITLGSGSSSYTVDYEIGESQATILERIEDAQSKIKEIFPDIESIVVGTGTDTNKLNITYKASAGVVPKLKISETTATGAAGTELLNGTLHGTDAAGKVGDALEIEIGDKSFEGVYQLYAYLNGTELLDIGKPVDPGDPSADHEKGPIVVTFSASGLLETVNGALATLVNAPPVTIYDADATANPNDPDLNKRGLIRLDISGTTQFASESIVKSSTQDGYTKGDLIGVNFNPDGTMVASFSNGQKSDLGIVALATFENQSGLQPLGDTAWGATQDSGQAILNEPGTGLNGLLRSAALEQSNVDLSEQLVKLIEAQRNFQANSKTLQTENSITQTILQIS